MPSRSSRARIASTAALAIATVALAATPASAQLTSDFDILFSDKDQKVGVAFDASYTFLTDGPSGLVSGTANVNGETSLSGTSLAFKNAVKGDTSFVWFGPEIGFYNQIVAKPISFEATDEFDRVNYKGSVNFMTEVPGTKDIGNFVADKIFGCPSTGATCTTFGLLVGVGASANVKVERKAGQRDRSSELVGTFNAAWRQPLRNDLVFVATYDWQNDSPDGSSSEASEVGIIYTFAGCDTGIKLSFIDGEFLPGEQRRQAVRVGLAKLIGAKKTC